MNTRTGSLFCFSLIALTFAAGCGSTEPLGDGSGELPSRLVLEKKTIRDPGSRNIESHSVLVPQGWKLDGQTEWASSKYYRLLPSNNISITSPTGVEASVFPTYSYSDPRPSPTYQFNYGIRRPGEGTSDGGYPVKYFPDSMEEWKTEVRELIGRKRPQAGEIRIRQVSDLPELTQFLESMNRSTIQAVQSQNQQARMMGIDSTINMSIRTFVFEMEYEEAGQTFEEILIFGLTETTTTITGMTQILWNVAPQISYRAPQGQLEQNLPLLMTLISSIKPTQEWNNMLFNHIARMNKIDRDAFEERMKLHRQTWSEISRMQEDGRRSRAAIEDETQRKVINCIRETSDYEFDGEAYQLPAGYEHVYTNGHDSIILTNDSLFNPNVDLESNLDWSTMKKIR